MITLDTSGLLALVDSADPYHTACIAVLDTDPGPYLLPVPILSEIAWMLENRYPSRVEKSFLEDIRTGAYELNWDSKDTARIEVLVGHLRCSLPL